MQSMIDSELKRFHDRVISPYDYSIYFRFIDLAFAMLISIVPLAIRNGASTVNYLDNLPVILQFMVVFTVIGHFQKLYHASHIFDTRLAIRKFFETSLISFFILLLIGAGLKQTQDYSRIWFFTWMGGFVLSGVSIRLMLISYIESELMKGNALHRALVVTIGQGGRLMEFSSKSDRKIRLVGHIEVLSLSNTIILESMARRLSADMIIIEVPWHNFQTASEIVAKTFWSAVQDVYVVPVFDRETIVTSDMISVERLGEHYMFKMKARPIGGWNDKIKRTEDILVSIIAVILTAPILIAAAIAIQLTSRGPILFRQKRQGFAGEVFDVWKFRTMYVDTSDHDAKQQTARHDPRVTRVGRFLRRTSIDELPQFFNVLQGYMSVVGPRPHALGTSVEGRALHEVVDRYESRFRVKPGITGWAQVNGWRGELTNEYKIRNRVDHDRYYIENWSIYFDIRIIFLTIIRVIYDPRAY